MLLGADRDDLGREELPVHAVPLAHPCPAS